MYSEAFLSMTRILLVTNIFPPHIGGPATFIDQLGHALARSGHRVTVVCSSNGPTEPSDVRRPFRVRRVLRRNMIIHELNVQVILMQEMLRHTHVLVNGLERQAYQVAKRLGRRYVLKVVGDTVWETARNAGLTTLSIDEFQLTAPENSDLRRLVSLRDKYVRHARVVVTPSEYLRQMVIGWGVDPSRVLRVFNGVSQEEFAAYKPRVRDGGVLEVIFIGRLTNWKGVETLLLAAVDLEGIHVSVVGDGPELPHLVELARQLRLQGKVEFTSRLERTAVHERLSQSHVLVLTSMYEGLSHTLLEAMAMGVPCIASGCGGNTEMIRSGENGLLVGPQDVEALRVALQTVRNDENMRYGLACKAKEDSKFFSFPETVQRTVEIVIGSELRDCSGSARP